MTRRHRWLKPDLNTTKVVLVDRVTNFHLSSNPVNFKLILNQIYTGEDTHIPVYSNREITAGLLIAIAHCGRFGFGTYWVEV